jgi:hypothetical protein
MQFDADFFCSHGDSIDIYGPPLERQEYLRIAEEFVRTEYPGVDCCVAYGSSVTGSAKSDSDIDLLIVKRDAPLVSKEQCFFNRRLIQPTIVASAHIKTLIDNCKNTGEPFFCIPFLSNSYIYGDIELFEELRLQANSIFLDGPDGLRAFALKHYRDKISNLCARLCSSFSDDDFVDKCTNAFFLCTAVQEFSLRYNRRWIYLKPRLLREAFTQLNAKWSEALYGSLDDTLKTRDFLYISNTAWEIAQTLQ